MGAKINSFRKQKPRLVQKLLDQSVVQAKRIAKEIEKIQREDYAVTTDGWNTSGLNPEPKPAPKFKTEIHRNQKGVQMAITSSMMSGGSVSRIWYWLDQGTPDRIQKKTSPPIKERKTLQTQVGRLRMERFAGFTGKTFVIRAGRPVKGIRARDWSAIIAEETVKEIQPALRAMGFKFRRRVFK